jgi:co-chaperonin GroES (HSP10)
MNEIIPMNEYVLVKLEDNKTKGVYFGDDKDKPKIGEILAFSKECKNKNFEVGKKVSINRYEMIPNGDSEDEFFVSEKAIIAMF